MIGSKAQGVHGQRAWVRTRWRPHYNMASRRSNRATDPAGSYPG